MKHKTITPSQLRSVPFYSSKSSLIIAIFALLLYAIKGCLHVAHDDTKQQQCSHTGQNLTADDTCTINPCRFTVVYLSFGYTVKTALTWSSSSFQWHPRGRAGTHVIHAWLDYHSPHTGIHVYRELKVRARRRRRNSLQLFPRVRHSQCAADSPASSATGESAVPWEIPPHRIIQLPYDAVTHLTQLTAVSHLYTLYLINSILLRKKEAKKCGCVLFCDWTPT